MIYTTSLLISICCFVLMSAACSASILRNNYNNDNNNKEEQRQRRLAMDQMFDNDICKNGERDYGPCNESKLPTCPSGTQRCYNRKPFKDRFFDDNRQPKYYIDYGLVYCYPTSWKVCSSCTPGRYCLAENRCILDEIGYPCAEWF